MTDADVASLVARYGLLAVFAGAFVEGEGVLIVAAIFAGRGVLDPVLVWLTASAGAWLGHLFWFATGRAVRRCRLAPRPTALWTRAVAVKRLIEARPAMMLVLLQYLYGTRLVGAVAVGLTELSALRFAVYESVNCLVWAALVGGLAYLVGGLVTALFQGWIQWLWMLASAVIVILLVRFVERLLERLER